jgi:hypothetical protein
MNPAIRRWHSIWRIWQAYSTKGTISRVRRGIHTTMIVARASNVISELQRRGLIAQVTR